MEAYGKAEAWVGRKELLKDFKSASWVEFVSLEMNWMNFSDLWILRSSSKAPYRAGLASYIMSRKKQHCYQWRGGSRSDLLLVGKNPWWCFRKYEMYNPRVVTCAWLAQSDSREGRTAATAGWLRTSAEGWLEVKWSGPSRILGGEMGGGVFE